MITIGRHGSVVLLSLVATLWLAQSCKAPGDSGDGGGGDDGSMTHTNCEICGNGLDDNGDGKVDEGCPCECGTMQACYPGDPCDVDIGVCKMGAQECIKVGDHHEWGPCEGAVLPSEEVCDNLDNDCDGEIDDIADPPACIVPGVKGQCEHGVEVCQDGIAACAQIVFPKPEQCDSFDNDCDGAIDNGNPGGGGSCTTGLPGVCSPGGVVCIGGALQCVQQAAPSLEVCDNLDNDCDGAVDEGDPGGGAPCSTGLPGVCGAGETACQGGGIVCKQNVGPSAEVCGDGLDNDCNGVIDDPAICNQPPPPTPPSGLGNCRVDDTFTDFGGYHNECDLQNEVAAGQEDGAYPELYCCQVAPGVLGARTKYAAYAACPVGSVYVGFDATGPSGRQTICASLNPGYTVTPSGSSASKKSGNPHTFNGTPGLLYHLGDGCECPTGQTIIHYGGTACSEMDCGTISP